MLEFIIFVCPGFIAAEVYRRIKKEERSIYGLLLYTAQFSLVILFLNYMISYCRGWEDVTVAYMGLKGKLKYMFSGFVMAHIIPYVYNVIGYMFGRYITGSIKPEK